MSAPIAFKGFMLGYLSKEAVKPDPSKQRGGRDVGTYFEPGGAPEPTPYGDLGKTVGGLWPGAAIGAAGVGGASLGIDALRGKPMNIRRALLLSVLLGIPLGAAGQMGLGGGKGFKQFGGQVAGAGRQALKDILQGAGQAKAWGADQLARGKAKIGAKKSAPQPAMGLDVPGSDVTGEA